MIRVLKAIASAVPDWLRKFIGYGVAAGIAMGIIVFVILAFRPFTDFVKDKLGIPERTQAADLVDAVQVASEDQLLATMVFVANERAAHDSARNAALFDTLSTTVIEPGIKRLNSIERQVVRLSELMGVSNGLISEQINYTRETKSRMALLQEQMNSRDPAAEQADREEMLRIIRTLTAKLDSLAAASGKRTSKVKL